MALLLGDFAGFLRQKGDSAGAEKAIRKALDIGRRSPLRTHPAMIEGLLGLGDAERDRSRTKEAESLYREALKIARQSGRSNLVAGPASRLIDLLRKQNRHQEADMLAGGSYE